MTWNTTDWDDNHPTCGSCGCGPCACPDDDQSTGDGKRGGGNHAIVTTPPAASPVPALRQTSRSSRGEGPSPDATGADRTAPAAHPPIGSRVRILAGAMLGHTGKVVRDGQFKNYVMVVLDGATQEAAVQRESLEVIPDEPGTELASEPDVAGHLDAERPDAEAQAAAAVPPTVAVPVTVAAVIASWSAISGWLEHGFDVQFVPREDGTIECWVDHDVIPDAVSGYATGRTLEEVVRNTLESFVTDPEIDEVPW